MRHNGRLWVPEHDGIRGYRRIPPGLPLVDPLRCPPLPDVGRMPMRCAYAILPISTAVRSTNNNSATTTAIDTSGASLIVLTVGANNGTWTVTDSASNTWTALTRQASGSIACGIYYKYAPTTSTTHTFTITATGLYPAIAVQVFNGALVSSDPFDQQNGAVGSGTSLASGSITPTEDSELVVGGCGFTGGTAVGVDAAFTLTSSLGEIASSWGVAMAYEIQTSATTREVTFSKSGTNNYAVCIASFKAAAAGGGTCGRLPLLGAGGKCAVSFAGLEWLRHRKNKIRKTVD